MNPDQNGATRWPCSLLHIPWLTSAGETREVQLWVRDEGGARSRVWFSGTAAMCSGRTSTNRKGRRMRWRTGVGVRVTLKLCTILLAGQKHNLFDIQMAQYEIALDKIMLLINNKSSNVLFSSTSPLTKAWRNTSTVSKNPKKMNHSNSNQAILLCTTGFIEEIKIVPGRAV